MDLLSNIISINSGNILKVKFNDIAPKLLSYNPVVTSLEILPFGVLQAHYPPNSTDTAMPIGYDEFANTTRNFQEHINQARSHSAYLSTLSSLGS